MKSHYEADVYTKFDGESDRVWNGVLVFHTKEDYDFAKSRQEYGSNHYGAARKSEDAGRCATCCPSDGVYYDSN